MSSSDPSADPPSIFDTDDNDPDASSSASSRTSNGFDLMPPPPPNVTLTNAEVLSVRLFSTDHLNLIIHHQPLFSQFIAFLNEYRPNHAPTLIRYLETLKAAAAVDYANAIARQIVGPEKTSSATLVAATLSSKFGSGSRRVAEQLVNDALPAYITLRLTNVVTELLINEITGCHGGTRSLVSGLAEAYCLTDPSRPGNPIVYASEGFHTTTLYGRDFVLGRNCRFLQGPKSSRATVARISAALRNGQENSELILNYRRDGSPFLNLCLIAPLHDNRGNVRYFIGCQIDVTNLVEGCQGLESFQMLLDQDQQKHRQGASAQQQEKDALEALGRLGELLSLDEMETIRSKGRPGSDSRSATPARGHRPLASNSQLRRHVSVEDSGEAASARVRAANRLNHTSGRFPSVYETFMLVRPYPSLRITFTSPALRIPGLLQSRLLDRIGGPHTVREYIRTSLAEGARITAKVNWLTNSGHQKTPSLDRAGRPHVDIHGRAPPHYSAGKPRWIHCTPLYGADENVGVWMVVMVEPDEDGPQYSSHSGSQESVLHRDRRNHPIYPTRSDSSRRIAHAKAAPVSGRKAPSPAPSQYSQRAAPNSNETLSALRHGDTRLDTLSPNSYSQSSSPLPSFQASRATPHLINTSHAACKHTDYGPASVHHSSSAARAIFDHHGQNYHDSHSASGVQRSRSLTTNAITMGTAITTNSTVPAPSYYPPPAGYPPKPPTPTIDELAASLVPPSRSGTPAFTLTEQLSPHNRPAFTSTPTLPSSKLSSPAPGRAGLQEESETSDDTAEEASGSVTPLADGAAGTPANTPRRGGYDVDNDDGRAGRSVMAPSRTGSISTSSTTLRAGRLTPVTAGGSGLSGRTLSMGRSLVRGAKEKDGERKREREKERERESAWEQQQQQQQQQNQGRNVPLTVTTAQRSRTGSSAHAQSPAAANNTTSVAPRKVELVKGLHRQASMGSSAGSGRRNNPANANNSRVTPTTALPLQPPPHPPRSPALVREKSKRGGLSSILTSSKSSLKGMTALKDKEKDKPLDKGKERDRGADRNRELPNASRERKGGGGGARTRTPTPTLGIASTLASAGRSGSTAGSGSSGQGRDTPLTALPAPPREQSPRLEVHMSGLGQLDV